MEEHFCPCTSLKCDKNPINHNKGCDLCIIKNLERNEIPSCFFLKVNDDVNEVKDYSIDGFVKFYLKHNN